MLNIKKINIFFLKPFLQIIIYHVNVHCEKGEGKMGVMTNTKKISLEIKGVVN